MEKSLLPRPIGGSIAAIASKSHAHRLLICAALADRKTEIRCGETSADIEATAGCLQALGAEIEYKNGIYTVLPIKNLRKNALLDCGESGSTLRFLLPVAAALGAQATFQMHGRLPQRPLSPLWELLQEHGCCLSRPTQDRLHCAGQLHGGEFAIAGNVSSQFISGLLFAMPLLKEPSRLSLTTPLESAGYVELTEAALADFGGQYRSRGAYAVEGDWSNAAFWLCAGAVSRSVTVSGLNLNSAQGDKKILELLRGFGAELSCEEGQVRVAPAPLQAIDIDAGQIPDLVPPLALVAACARGVTTIYGAERLRMKESDRLQSVAQCINALGGQAEITADGLRITGKKLTGGRVSSQNDHRIAMLAAVASGVCSREVTIEGSEAVQKSYPKFWEDFSAMVK